MNHFSDDVGYNLVLVEILGESLAKRPRVAQIIEFSIWLSSVLRHRMTEPRPYDYTFVSRFDVDLFAVWSRHP